MRFTETPLSGTYLIDLEKKEDERGFFARSFCREEFAQKGIETSFVQANNSLSAHKGTLRGLHYQLEPASETKLVRCIKGSLFDVVLDLRKESPSFGKWFGAILSEDNRTMLTVPRGCAHGFITLTDNCEIFYLVSNFYSKELERGIRWNDPTFNIQWPISPVVISERDQNHPHFKELHS